ncbi:unnamed protein product [Arctia plantaginis]|uniref:Major facilitator superfamily (MFS) profile domain-containing protein n=1 Tax=Arctia plantaginis TaxID=874455 RepID=A0A8S1AZ67_ARCPL|nr:unnamed protein product [Arctia plantaginis]CAB3250919.1 unnamed protein product [Arctia plantaginis]
MDEDTSKIVSKNNFKDAGWGYRHQQCFILFCTYTIAYSMKSCMGVAVVAMTKYPHNENNTTDFKEQNTTTEFRPEGFLNALILVPPYPIFNWNKKLQDTIIASFYWGYMILQLPAGYLVHRVGVKNLLTGAMATSFVILTVLPTAAYYGSWYCTVLCRFTQGLSQACLIPGLHYALGKWAPHHERGRLGAFVYGGQAVGTLLGLPITGFISASPMGWPGIFRFYGILSGLMAVIIWFLLFDTPAKHPKISFLEQKYIEDDIRPKERIPVPWLKILRHKGVYAIIFAQIAGAWGHLTLYSEVPAYMDKVMKVNIKANGVLTALPFLAMWLANFFFSWLTDWLIIKNIMSVTNTRKFANSLGYFPAGIGLIALAYVPRNIYFVETLLVLICVFKISAHCGYLVNHMDISPNFAGPLISLSNFVSHMGTSLSPIVIAHILTDAEDKYLWRKVFFLTAGIYFTMNTIYLLFGTGERAEWDDPKVEQEVIEENLSMINA